MVYFFLSPIEAFLEKNKEKLDSKELVFTIRESLSQSLDDNPNYSGLPVYKKIEKKVNIYLHNGFTKDALQYYSWILDELINSINKSNEWNTIVDSNEWNENDITKDRKNMYPYSSQVFLSYSSIDKALTYWLYRYFNERHVFLYVDWMFGKYYDSGIDSKKHLEKVISQSDKFLYLRTLNSEQAGGKYTRSWCGWEIGISNGYNDGYQYHCDDFAVSQIVSPSILDGFKDFIGADSTGEFY